MSLSLVGWKRYTTWTGLALALCVLLQACGNSPRTPGVTEVTPAPSPALPAYTQAVDPRPRSVSSAQTPHEYRLHAARHVYDQHATHIYNGPLPPLLQAVGVLNIEIGAQGEVRRVNWLRAPSHVPEVMRQIERMVHSAAPYPVPVHLQSVTYTDTWLWHRSGRFQLHTLSEGQLGEIETVASQDPKRRSARRASSAPSSTLTAKCAHPSPPAAQVAAYC